MKHKRLSTLMGLGLASLLIVGAYNSASAQGRGGGPPSGVGRGGGPPSGVGRGGGPPSGVGVDRGIGTASERSGGRSNQGLSTASERSNGRSDDGLARARAARDNSLRADQELRNNPGIAESLHVNPNDLRSRYQAALARNPDLKFGQFVAANVLARNLGAGNPNITTAAILSGLADGQSIGGTLQNLGLNSSEAKEAVKNAKRAIKESKRGS
ncbi:MAG: hypothetical protein M3410_01450 [Acidobacteriota bacterium]|nr:hypothetical protein [Acidobacteriota bacterium]